jgi:2,2-dialkylglycine decarboxylase (pyruvate)
MAETAHLNETTELSAEAKARRDELWELAERHVFRHSGPYDDYLIERAEGCYIFDDSGRKILDFTSGQLCSTLGHNHPEIVAAIEESCRTAIHLFSWSLSPVVIELCRELAALLPPSLQKVLPLSTGSESNEAAIRMAKLESGGYEVVAFDLSWHGATGGSLAHSYAGARRGTGPMVPGTLTLPTPNAYHCPIRHCDGACDCACLDVGFEMVDRASTGAMAACIVEPVISAGGLIVPPNEYFRRLKQKCEERGMYLIFDEAQTGLGRTGKTFAYEHSGVVPDFLTLSKTLGGGVPLSATVTSPEMEQSCFDKGFLVPTSHVCDPMPAAAGLAVLKVLVRDKLAEHAAELGAHLREGLLAMQQRYEIIGDVRGMGMLQGVEVVKDRHTRESDPELGHAVTKRALELGVSMNIVSHGSLAAVWRIAPPLTVTKEELDLGLEILEQAIQDCLEKKAA